MSTIKTLCVYCGSSARVDDAYLIAADELGRKAAERSIRLVFGGGRVGMMGRLADAALEAGGEVVGIIPEHLDSVEIGHRHVTDLEIVDSMHSRKMRMFELSDAFCILPGGLGTLDETFEMLTWRQLRLHDKPVMLVNIAGYWDPLSALIQSQVEAGFVRPEHAQLLSVVPSVDALFEALGRQPEPKVEPKKQRL